jgi:hypothetical protein
VTTQCVELRHRSQKDEINNISRPKYPNTQKEKRLTSTLAPPGCKLDSFLSIRCDHFQFPSFFYLILFFIFLFSSIGTGIFSYSSCSHSPSFPSQSFTIIDPVAGKTFAICHFDRHLFFFLLLTQSTPTSPPFHASIPSAPLVMIDTSQVRSKPIDLGCRRELEGRKKN